MNVAVVPESCRRKDERVCGMARQTFIMTRIESKHNLLHLWANGEIYSEIQILCNVC